MRGILSALQAATAPCSRAWLVRTEAAAARPRGACQFSADRVTSAGSVTPGVRRFPQSAFFATRCNGASLTSAIRGGQGRSFGHLGEKSALPFGRSGDGQRHAQALREIEPEPIEEGGLRGVRAHDAAQAEFAAV